jgi:uncharacterized heparinase superfamily protein
MSETLAHEVARNVNALEENLNLDRKTDPESGEKHVEALLRGRILFSGRREVETGLEGIDWSGSHVQHQKWPAQLNRFFWLQHLAVLYERSGEESLPELARRTIESRFLLDGMRLEYEGEVLFDEEEHGIYEATE